MKFTRQNEKRNVRSVPPIAKEHAGLLRDLGVAICRIDSGKKQPSYPCWSTRSLDVDDIGHDDHIGILTGALSICGRVGYSLLGVDLDSSDAVHLADRHLPATDMTEGRPSKVRSHRYFLIPNNSVPPEEHSTAAQAGTAAMKSAGHTGPRTRSFRNTHGREILRLLGTGGQLVCPPSLHPSGERRSWDTPKGLPGRPAVVLYGDLRAAVERLAKVCGYEPRTGHTAGTVVTANATTGVKLDHWLEYRIEKYLDACPRAVSGRDGHGQLFSVAVAMVNGFGLDPETALAIIKTYYNPRCRPTWTVAELRHKVEDAARVPHDKPRGYLLSGSANECALPADTPAVIRVAFVEAVTGRQGRLMRCSRRGGN